MKQPQRVTREYPLNPNLPHFNETEQRRIHIEVFREHRAVGRAVVMVPLMEAGAWVLAPGSRARH